MIKYQQEISHVFIYINNKHVILVDKTKLILAVRTISSFKGAKSISNKELQLTFVIPELNEEYSWDLFLPVKNHLNFVAWLTQNM